MEPTLLSGDVIIVNKMSYGARSQKLKFLSNKKDIVVYFRVKGLDVIKKGDVIIFNKPNYKFLSDSSEKIFGRCIIKRCYEIPGSNVIIKNTDTKNAKKKVELSIKSSPNLFPFDSVLRWEVDNYGPLFVPGKDKILKLTPYNCNFYKDVLLYEGYKSKVKNDSVFLNNHFTKHINFRHNYYFMIGDNFYESQDSRYWGFVPDDCIIGKASLVLFSYGEDGFRWNRLIKLIY